MIGSITLGCSAEMADGADEAVADDDDEGDDGIGSDEAAISVSGRWKLPADVRAAGARVRVTYSSQWLQKPRSSKRMNGSVVSITQRAHCR